MDSCPSSACCSRSIGICIGSDSNVRIDPLEELRQLEGIARRQTGGATSSRPSTLLCFGADEGAGALGLEDWDDLEVDLTHRSLRGVDGRLRGPGRRLRRGRVRLTAVSCVQ